MNENVHEPLKMAATDASLRIIMDASPVGIIVFDHDARIEYANDVAEQLFDQTVTAPDVHRCGDFISCAHCNSDPEGCGRTAHCPTCPLFLAIRAAFEPSPDAGSLEGEALLAREPERSDLWVKFKVKGVAVADRRFAVMAFDDITSQKRAQQELSHALAELSLIHENAPIAMMLVDRDRKVQKVNGFAAKFAGRRPSEMIGMTGGEALRCLHHLDDPQGCGFGPACVECRVRQAVLVTLETENNQPETEAWLPFSNNGTPTQRCLLISTAYLKTENAERVLVCAQDITERKKAEQALLQSEEKFRLAFSASPDSVNINRLEDGLYVDINDGFTRLTGFTREDVIGKRSLELNIWKDPEDRQKLVQGLRENGFLENLEAQFRRKDGSLLTGLMSAAVIHINNEPHSINIIRDITELKTIQEALRKSEQKYRRLIENAGEAIFVARDGMLIFTNPKLEQTSGYSGEELRSRPFIEFIHSDDREMVMNNHLKRMRGIAVPSKYAFRIIHKSGAIRTVELSVVPIEWDEKPATLNFLMDTTERQQLEVRLQQAQKMEAIGALAAGIAHDFNNLLFPITGMSEMLLEDFETGSPQHSNVGMIYSAAMRAKDLVNQILSFSRQVEHRKMAIRLQPIIREVIKLARSSIPSNIPIQEDIQPECGVVLADPTHLHQVIMNLVTNAFHAVEHNSGSITVALRQIQLTQEDAQQSSLSPGAYALLAVSDSGHGIPPEAMPNLFDPYFTTKPKGKGTGLGLSVCYGIAKDLGGEIKAYSEVDKGTVFNVYLPLLNRDDATAAAPGAVSLPTGTERILVVDDEAPIVKLEKQMLERLGYLVFTRTSSLDALEAFRADPAAYDLVISDMAMPNMTGAQLAGHLMALRPDIPIIICTGFSDKMSQDKARRSGIKGFLMKPLIRADLAKTVRQVLDDAGRIAGG